MKPGGKFIFSIVHPAFYTAKWECNEEGIKTSLKVERYLTSIELKQDIWGVTRHYHRPIHFYFNKITNLGFCLQQMFEPKDRKGTGVRADIPLYLFAEFIKS